MNNRPATQINSMKNTKVITKRNFSLNQSVSISNTSTTNPVTVTDLAPAQKLNTQPSCQFGKDVAKNSGTISKNRSKSKKSQKSSTNKWLSGKENSSGIRVRKVFMQNHNKDAAMASATFSGGKSSHSGKAAVFNLLTSTKDKHGLAPSKHSSGKTGKRKDRSTSIKSPRIIVKGGVNTS